MHNAIYLVKNNKIIFDYLNVARYMLFDAKGTMYPSVKREATLV